MKSTLERSPDVEQAAERLRRPRARGALAAKRALDVVLAATMIVALLPLFALVGLLLISGGAGGRLERRVRLGRGGAPIRLLRFRALPGRWGRALERCGARELPLLWCVLAGRLSLVGPRASSPDAEPGETGPRRLMTPGVTGPAQRWATDSETAGELDDAYVTEWSLAGDVRLLLGLRGRAPRPVSTGLGH